MGKALNILSNVVSGALERQLTCECCGDTFTCGASLKGCWCAEIQLTDEVRAELRSRYSDCLCRNCLEKFAGSVIN